MGNVDSSNAFAGVDELKDTLAGLETRLASIEAGHRNALHDAELDMSNDHPGGLRPSDAGSGGGGVVVAGATVSCDRGVNVLTGPVIGLVAGDQARVLLEVDRDTEIIAHVCLVDESCPGGRPVATSTMRFTARRAACFTLTRLLPGERYIICFSGLKRADALERVADFKTIDLANREVRLLAVSGDHPEAVSAGEFNVMETVFERLKHAHLPHVDVLLHAGGNVHLKQAFEDAWVLLKRNAEVCSGEFDHRAWETAMGAAEERLRCAYRFAWNLPFTRQCLAITSNLMLGGEEDIYPNFMICPELSSEGGGFVAATIVRLARRVYWTYQRQLWDAEVDGMLDLDTATVNSVTKTMEARLHRQSLEKAVARADGAVAELKSVKIDPTPAEAVLLSKRTDLQDANAKEQAAAKLSMKGGRGPAPLESALISITGHVGILLLDSLFSALAADGSQLPTPDSGSRVFLPEALWVMLEANLGVDSHIRCLVVVSASPIADTTRENTRAARANTGDFDAVVSRWSAQERDQEHILSYLFDWKSKEAYRELLFVSGGVRCGSMSMIRDDLWSGSDSKGGRARQLVAGSITDFVEPWPFSPLEGRLGLHSRFSFRHKPLNGQRSYAEALILVPPPSTDIAMSKLKTSISNVDVDRASFAHVAGAKVIGQFFEEVRVVVGPVIGTVTATSAVVLVEVDSSAPVAAVLTDTLSGAQVRQLRLLPKSRPYAFGFEGLEPARHYSLRLEGVENADTRRGGFTTCEKATRGKFRLKVLALHSDRPFSNIHSGVAADAAHTTSDENSGAHGGGSGFSLWRSLETEAARPYGPDVFIHLGGQVEMASVVEGASALLSRAQRLEGSAALELEEAARDMLRGGYRTHWNLPATRNALANGCHLMLRGAQDIGELLLGPSNGGVSGSAVITGTDRARLVCLVEGVYREYQRQLWDPTLGLDGGVHLGCSRAPLEDKEGNGEWHYHQYGSVGFFMMDIRSERLKASEGASSGVPLISPDQWRGLNDVLAQTPGPSHLVMCSELPFVSDGPDAAAMKAATSTHAHLASHWPAHGVELRKLMRGLFTWKGSKHREVTLLSGGAGYVLSSVLNQKGGGSIRQYISPSISDAVERCWCEPFGSLDDRLSYAHGVAVASNGVAFLDFTSTGGPVGCTHTPISSLDCEGKGGSGTTSKQQGSDDEEDENALLSSNMQLTDRPGAFKALLERPEWLEMLLARAQNSVPPTSVQRRLDALSGLLNRSDSRASLKRVFHTDLRNGNHPWFANAEAFAACAGPALQLWFYKADDTLRAVTPAPSPLLLEAVARRWDAPKPPPSSRKATAGVAVVKSTAISSGPSVRLSLLDADTWIEFASEVLALGVVVQDRLRNSDHEA